MVTSALSKQAILYCSTCIYCNIHNRRCMVEWAPIKGAATNPLPHPTLCGQISHMYLLLLLGKYSNKFQYMYMYPVLINCEHVPTRSLVSNQRLWYQSESYRTHDYYSRRYTYYTVYDSNSTLSWENNIREAMAAILPVTTTPLLPAGTQLISQSVSRHTANHIMSKYPH